MRRNKLKMFLHLIWGTWDRLPLITPDIERRLLRNIESEARKLGCTVLAINSTEDHIHILVKIPATITVANLLKQLKGVSSHFVNETLRPPFKFKWQDNYGAFTVSRWDVDKIKGYIKRQKEHHRSGDLVKGLEASFEVFDGKTTDCTRTEREAGGKAPPRQDSDRRKPSGASHLDTGEQG